MDTFFVVGCARCHLGVKVSYEPEFDVYCEVCKKIIDLIEKAKELEDKNGFVG